MNWPRRPILAGFSQFVALREPDQDPGSLAAGTDFQRTAQLPNSLAHAGNSYPSPIGALFLERYSFSSVNHFESHLVLAARQSHRGGRALRVSQDVCQRLLRDPKERCFQITGQPPKVWADR